MIDLRYQSNLANNHFHHQSKKKPKTGRSHILHQWWGNPQSLVFSVCAATAEILFLQGAKTGALLLTAMLLQPAVLLMGIIGVVSAVGFASVVQLDQTYRDKGALLFNPLLAGLSVGYLFQPSGAAIFLAAGAGILAFLLTYTLSHILYIYFLLPILSLPFIAVSWIVHLAAFHYAGLQHGITPSYAYSIGMPAYIEGFLRTLGLIFFLPNIWVGMIVALLLLWNSRIQFLLALFSYYLGTTIRGVLTGTFLYVYFDPAALNFILVALAIGGYYLLPSPRSYLLAALGVGMTALLSEAISVFWAAVGLPVHALPYNVITLLMLYLLGLAGCRSLARSPQSSPEKTLDHELTARLRYQGSGRVIALPFSGNWIVWQGYNGKWTHQGIWRYACDFVIQDDQQQTFRGDGLQLSDYYAFQKPVLSPVTGWVVRVVNDLPDGAIGSVDTINNWGNHLIIYDERGFYVEISHFAQNSILVKPGDRLSRGSLIGRCGNSGYSPQPHIHIQVQLTPELGSATVPFSFVNLMVDDEFHPEAIPTEGSKIAPLAQNDSLGRSLTFPLDSQLDFSMVRQGKVIGKLTVVVKMATDGLFYLDSGIAKLFFTRDQDKFIFHRLEGNDSRLALLFTAMPKIPLIHQAGHKWSDYLPISTVVNGMRCSFYQFCSSFYPKLASARYMGKWESDNTLVGLISIPHISPQISTLVMFDHEKQLLRVSVGDRTLVRVF